MINIGDCRECGLPILREEGTRGRKPVYCQSCREDPAIQEAIKTARAAEARAAGDERAQRLMEMLELNRISHEERKLRLEEVLEKRDYGGKRR